MSENKTKISLGQDDVMAAIFTLAQSSCGFREVEHDLWHLHCCDYNEPVFRIVSQIDIKDIEGQEEKAYISRLQEEARKYFEEDSQ